MYVSPSWRFWLLSSLLLWVAAWPAHAQRFKRESVEFEQWLPPAVGDLDDIYTYRCVVEHAPGATYRFPVSEENIFPRGIKLKNLVRVDKEAEADLELRVYFGAFELVSLKENSSRGDNGRLYFYDMEYTYPITYEVIHVPSGRYLFRNVIKERKSETLNTFGMGSKSAMRQYWQTKGGGILRDLELITVSDAYRAIHKYNQLWFEYEKVERSSNFSYVHKSRDFSYPEMDKGLASIQQAAEVLTDSVRGLTDKGKDLVLAAIEAWRPLIEDYDPNIEEGRITEKVYREANLNTAQAYLMIYDLDQAAQHFTLAEDTRGMGLRGFGTEYKLEKLTERLVVYQDRWDGQVRPAPETEAEPDTVASPVVITLPARLMVGTPGMREALILLPILVTELKEGDKSPVPQATWAEESTTSSLFDKLSSCENPPSYLIGADRPYPRTLLLPPQGVGGQARESLSALWLDHIGTQPSTQIMDWEENLRAAQWYRKGQSDSLWQWMLQEDIDYAFTAHIDQAQLVQLQNSAGSNLGYDLVFQGRYMVIDIQNQCLHVRDIHRSESEISASISSGMVLSNRLNLTQASDFDSAQSVIREDNGLKVWAILEQSIPAMDSLIFQTFGFQFALDLILPNENRIPLQIGNVKHFAGLERFHPAEILTPTATGGWETIGRGELIWDEAPPSMVLRVEDEQLPALLSAQQAGQKLWVQTVAP